MLIDHAAAAPALTLAGKWTAPTEGITTAYLTNVFTSVIQLLCLIAGAIAVIYLIWAGIQYITSAGDPAKAKTARAAVINAVIGIVIIVATYAIISFAAGLGRDAAGAISGQSTGSGSGSGSTNQDSTPSPTASGSMETDPNGEYIARCAAYYQGYADARAQRPQSPGNSYMSSYDAGYWDGVNNRAEVCR